MRLSSFRQDVDLLKDVGAGVQELLPGGPVLAVPEGKVPKGPLVLEFDYFSVGGAKSFHVLPGPPFEAKTAILIEAPGHSEVWSSYVSRLSGLPEEWSQLRFDIVLEADRVMRVRNARIRPEREGEFNASGRPRRSVADEILRAELSKEYPASIEAVDVGESTVRVSGKVGATEDAPLLADIPMDLLLMDSGRFEVLEPISVSEDGSFSVELPRMRTRSGHAYDRLTSRWRVVKKAGNDVEVLSHARYAEKVAARDPAPPLLDPVSKKGLGGWNAGVIPGELGTLGIAAVTVNVVVDTLLAPVSGPGTLPFEWQARTFHARKQALERFDRTFLGAAADNAMVSAILLVGNPAKGDRPGSSVLAHPDATREGTFALADVSSEEGIAAYGGLLNLMAERWSRADGKFGRVHHWIVHNEVDAAWVWTNAGAIGAVSYMDLYQRSMRLTDLIVRQHDPNARAFISLTHHWAEAGTPKFYGSKQMLELLASFGAVEGDFPWALAHHPYPQNLRNPRTWEDHQASFSFGTKKITPRNLEVLDAWMRHPRMLYQGEPRLVHLTENGFNSPDLSPKSLTDQAAGMAYAWKKMARLPTLRMWHYHNWIDNPHEGGLRIGLRKLPGEPTDPRGPKPIWHLYKDLGTDREDAACAPYLETIGIKDWDEIHHAGPIE
ncbi:peptidase S8 and S53 subtilisin/kexin/sedolisin [Haloferula helveola]|uniref:Peptidase S8 and S53 subtilisin/kexin/sedolisin n=1 Tax=Haloferula helveola TaxID=490095 RepID=A0ABM7R911_9BACT|nr:peptidase S8 and S53 subtilisin/kexin/sedolisin [Haloferula helveola]